MFERYTGSARRAIFYARASTLLKDAPALDSVHLLEGLMWRKGSRAQMLFRLRERLPSYSGQRFKAAALQTTINGKNPQLTNDAKKILAWTAMEADAMNEYWVDTDHLLLGILCESASLAAQHLAQARITLENARAVVMQHSRSQSKGPLSLVNWMNPGWRAWKRGKDKRTNA
jgi:ATP-dependent Clp protease ATP-binding subunit ClpA